jgi:hypothetical protein
LEYGLGVMGLLGRFIGVPLPVDRHREPIHFCYLDIIRHKVENLKFVPSPPSMLPSDACICFNTHLHVTF